MMKKFFRLFIVSLMSMGLFTPAQAAELTIYEGTATDRTIPLTPIIWNLSAHSRR